MACVGSAQREPNPCIEQNSFLHLPPHPELPATVPATTHFSRRRLVTEPPNSIYPYLLHFDTVSMDNEIHEIDREACNHSQSSSRMAFHDDIDLAAVCQKSASFHLQHTTAVFDGCYLPEL
jgi:hypothetical protein